ncbi:MAG: exonuclease SbcCD subunit D C-terminal domain-containing protein, partial [Faecalibacterium sp.]
QDVPEAMARLRVIYPNLMRLDYDNRRTREQRSVEGSALLTHSSTSPLEHFAAFYEAQNNQPLSEEQTQFCRALIEQIWKEGEDA